MPRISGGDSYDASASQNAIAARQASEARRPGSAPAGESARSRTDHRTDSVTISDEAKRLFERSEAEERDRNVDQAG